MLINRHIRSSGILMFIIFNVPRHITQNTKQRRTRQLMSQGQTTILFQRTRPSTIRARTNQFKHRAMNRRAQRNIAKMTTTAMFATRSSLSTNKLKPTISISGRGRTSSVVNTNHVRLAIVIVINIDRCNPYSNTTKFQVARAKFNKYLANFPDLKTTSPHICSNTFNSHVLAYSLKYTVRNVGFVRAERILSNNKTRIRRFSAS